MARARNIKPGFCSNEQLGECSLPARLCFALLPMLADRDGRLEDRPIRIKGELFRYDSIEVDPLLDELRARELIARYAVGGMRLIQILAFAKHQTPHHRESESVLPPPPGLRLDPEGKWVKPEAGPPCQLPEARGKPEARPHLNGQDATWEGGSASSDSLIPDSLIPDSLIPVPTQPAAQAPTRPSAEAEQLTLVGTPPAPKFPPDCPHQAVLQLWGEVLPQFPQHLASQWRGTRADHLRARWREAAIEVAKRDPEKAWKKPEDGLLYFRKLFAYVGRSPFLSGKIPPAPGKRPFMIELEWLVDPTHWARVHEGKYHEGIT